MGFFSRFEKHVEDGFENAADKMFDAPISPVQIAKKAEKAMRREKIVGAGRQYAPTLYTVLVNPQDDQRLFGYYPTLAGETETYLSAKAAEAGLLMDGSPLVRFIVDNDLKRGKFEIIAELVSAPIVDQLRQEEVARYGLADAGQQGYDQGYEQSYDQGYDPMYDQSYQQQTYNPAPQQDYDQYQQQTYNPAPQQVYNQYQQPQPSYQSGNLGNIDQQAAAAMANQQASARKTAAEGAGAAATPAAAAAANFHPQQRPAAPVAQPAPQQPQRYVSPYARLTNISTNQIYDLNGMTTTLGRGSDVTYTVGDINASRVHCELSYDATQGYIVRDLGSTNGTKVNGKRVTAQVLLDGDRLSLGLTNFLFTYRR